MYLSGELMMEDKSRRSTSMAEGRGLSSASGMGDGFRFGVLGFRGGGYSDALFP